MRGLSFMIFVLALVTPRLLLADEPPANPADEKEVIRKALDYVGTNSIAWLRVKKCASCHHVPMMVWAQREARDRGYPIDEDAWREATDFLLKELQG